MARSPFTRLAGVTQGRITPAGYTPPDGLFAFALGSDAPGVVYEFNTGDGLTLSQLTDVTGVRLVRFAARLRAPAQGPRWTFAWGLLGAPQGARVLRPARTIDIADACIDVSQVTGNQTLAFSLTVTP